MARVLFLQKIRTENLGPMYLSSVARQSGHECFLSIGGITDFTKAIQKINPDLIAFSVTTGLHGWMADCVKELKQIVDIPIILGGPHATYYPEVIESCPLDIICRGEGETAFVEILNRLDKTTALHGISNLWVKISGNIVRETPGNLIEDIDSIPLPDRELYYQYDFLRENENKSFITSRGCPYDCSYCSIAALREIYAGKGTFVRFHSPERVVDEIMYVKRTYGLRTVIFQDDTFILNQARLEKLMPLLAQKTGLPFVCHVRADLVTSDIARLLKEGGCHSVDFGVESGDEKLRNQLLGKRLSDDKIIAAAAILKTTGIRFRTTNMIGLPGETLTQAFSTIHLNQRIKTDYPSSSIYQPYPKTKLGDEVIASGILGEHYSVDQIGTSFFRSSIINGPQKNEMINLQKLFWPAVKFPILFPLIKRLLRVPPNKLYESVFLFCYALNYMLSENVSLKHVFKLGRRTVREFFFGK